jgi:hypothetical protein
MSAASSSQAAAVASSPGPGSAPLQVPSLVGQVGAQLLADLRTATAADPTSQSCAPVPDLANLIGGKESAEAVAAETPELDSEDVVMKEEESPDFLDTEAGSDDAVSDDAVSDVGEELSESDQGLVRLLQANRLCLFAKDPCPSDGNCFPSAIAETVKKEGRKRTANQMRKEIVAFLRQPANADLEARPNMTYRQMGPDFIELTDPEWKAWLDKMAQDKSWMEGACIFAAAAICRRNLVLLTNDLNEAHRVLLIGPRHMQGKLTPLKESAPIVLVYYINSHFTVPRHQQDATGQGIVRVRPIPAAISGSSSELGVTASASASSSSSSSVPYAGGRTIAMYNYKGGVAKARPAASAAAACE